MCRAPPTLATDAALAEGAARTDAVKKAILNSPVAVALAKAAEERRAAAEKRAAEQAAAAERAAKAAAERAAAEKAAAEQVAAEKAAAEKAEREKVAAEKAAAWRAIRAERDPKLTKDVATAAKTIEEVAVTVAAVASLVVERAKDSAQEGVKEGAGDGVEDATVVGKVVPTRPLSTGETEEMAAKGVGGASEFSQDPPSLF